MTIQKSNESMRIPAIVLTCQKYAPIAAHMIGKYGSVWPTNPFVFRVPDGSNTEAFLGNLGDRVEFIPTREGEGRGRFRQTVFDLLTGIDDEDWVYWCMDDKYPINLDIAAHEAITRRLASLPAIDALQLCRVSSPRTSQQLDDGIQIDVDGYTFHKRLTYHRIWIHQFLRAKVLRTLFGTFPEIIAQAKEMDLLKDALLPPSDQHLYVSTTSRAVLGESTTRGKLTTNCANSLRRGPGIPSGFEISPKSTTFGHSATQFAGSFSWNRSRIRRLVLGVTRRLRTVARTTNE